MVILNISEFQPAPIKAKERDNDILIVTAQKHAEYYPEVKHVFILAIPFVSTMTSFLLPKWRSFRTLGQQKKYVTHGQEIYVMNFFMRGYRIRILRPLFHWLSYITNKARLIRIVQEEKVTLIHAHHVQHSSYIAHRLSRKLNIPYVVTSRKIFSSIHSKQAKQDLNHAEAVISINHFYKKIIDQLVPSNSSHLLPHGLDAAFLTAEDKLLQPERGVVKLISISRLLPLKNIEHVLLALEKSNLPFVYDIYGDGPDFSRLINILAHLKIKDNVRFMGHVPHSEVPPILSQYDIFVLPSYPEGLGRVYLEAMGMGLPVIASKNTGIDGFITNGVSGMLVHPKNIDELSEALNKLIIDVPFRLDIAAAGRALMHQFSWDKIIPKLHTIYSSAISNYKKK